MLMKKNEHSQNKKYVIFFTSSLLVEKKYILWFIDHKGWEHSHNVERKKLYAQVLVVAPFLAKNCFRGNVQARLPKKRTCLMKWNGKKEMKWHKNKNKNMN